VPILSILGVKYLFSYCFVTQSPHPSDDNGAGGDYVRYIGICRVYLHPDIILVEVSLSEESSVYSAKQM